MDFAFRKSLHGGFRLFPMVSCPHFCPKHSRRCFPKDPICTAYPNLRCKRILFVSNGDGVLPCRFGNDDHPLPEGCSQMLALANGIMDKATMPAQDATRRI